MSTMRQHIMILAEVFASHEEIQHWGVSMRMEGKGDAILNLIRGGDMRSGTYERRLAWFSAHWPADLPWPADVPRPAVPAEDAAHQKAPT